MHLHAIDLIALSSCAAAAYIKPGVNLHIGRRADPALRGAGSTGSVANPLHRAIFKRTNPTFGDGDFGETKNGEDKKELLTNALKDVWTLAQVTLNNWDDTIFGHWFPSRDADKVRGVLRALIEDPSVDEGQAEGSTIMQYFAIDPTDTLAGTGDSDLCARGADAYTFNFPPSEDDGGPATARAHFCPNTFENINPDDPDDDEPDEVAPTLSDLQLDDFDIKGDGIYRITNEMEPIAATVMHEMIHFNGIAGVVGQVPPPEDGKTEPIIGDEAGPDPDVDYGEPYYSRELRRNVGDNDETCVRNADSYVWFAFESYWTNKYKDELADQDGYFFDPRDPTLTLDQVRSIDVNFCSVYSFMCRTVP